MKKIDLIKSNYTDFLRYLKGEYPLYHKSNVFFRDIQYGVMYYMKKIKGVKISRSDSEDMGRHMADFLEKKEILRRLDNRTWVLNYSEFSKKVSYNKI